MRPGPAFLIGLAMLAATLIRLGAQQPPQPPALRREIGRETGMESES
jgi:hypothetical protein